LNNTYRALSDGLYFTESNSEQLKSSLIQFLISHKNIRELEMLLTMLTSYNSTQSYIESLIKNVNTPLVDIVLFCIFRQINVTFYYLSLDGFSKLDSKFNFPYSKTLRFYLTPNGYFDTIYDKSLIKNAGICQSIILDVFFHELLFKDNFIKNNKE